MLGAPVFRSALYGPWSGNALWTAARAVPSLDLCFADTKSLVCATTGQNLITFTRASSGTYVGSDGLLKTATTNLLLRSEEFDNASWVLFGTATRSANATTAPNGTQTGDSVTLPVASGIYQIINGLPSVTYTLSIWVRADSSQSVRLVINTNLSDPVGNTINVSTTWQRYSITKTTSVGTTSVTAQLDTGGGNTFYLWGAQLEQSATVSEYIPTTSTINSAPRFDHNPTTGESLGLLVEESRTNLLLLSGNLYETGTGAGSWFYQTGTMSDNTQVAPDGTTTADTLTTTGGALSIYQSATVTASTTYTGSAYVRLGTMQASDFKVAVYNNSTPGFIAVDVAPSQTPTSSGWTRISYSFTTPAGCTSVRWYPFRNSAGLGSCTVHLWGAQLEAGAFPTSYIPTTTAAATRGADVASITGTAFSSWYRQDEGTVYWEGNPFASIETGYFGVQDSGGTSHIRISRSFNQVRALVTTSSSTQADIYSGNFITLGAGNKIALATKANDFALSLAGATVVTDTSGTMPAVDRATIGIGAFLPQMNGTIRRLTYWPQRLPNFTLQTLTQ